MDPTTTLIFSGAVFSIMVEWVPLAINIPLPPSALFSSPHSCKSVRSARGEG
jgi:hypothetical protein